MNGPTYSVYCLNATVPFMGAIKIMDIVARIVPTMRNSVGVILQSHWTRDKGHVLTMFMTVRFKGKIWFGFATYYSIISVMYNSRGQK